MNRMKKVVSAAIGAVLLCSSMAIPALPATAVDSIQDKYEWGTLKIGGGGFVSGIVTGKDVMYARTDVGGAYKYNYDTESWEQLFGFLTEADRGLLSVDAMAVDPTDDNTAYFLCGCAYFSAEKTVIFKTTDGGKTFKEINVTNLIKVMGNGDGRQFGEAIAVDPDNPKVIYAGGDVTADAKSKSALIKSTDGGETWEPVIGYDDLGLFDQTTLWPTWTDNVARCTIKGAYQTQNGVSAIAITGGKIYVATAKTGVANVHAASTKDDKFTALSKDLPTDVFPSRINVDPNGNLLISYMAGLAFMGGSGGGYRYNVKDGKVEQILEGTAGYGSIWTDPKNPDHMIAGTCGKWMDQEWEEWTEEHGPCWGDQYFRSLDGGKTWENFTPGKKAGEWGKEHLVGAYLQTGGYDWIYDKAIHWSGTVVTDPRDSSRMFITSGNGVFIAEDIWNTEKPVVFTFHPDGIEEVVSLDFVSTADGLDLSAIGDYDGFVHANVYDIPPQYKPNMGSTSAIAVCPQNTDVWARTANGDGNNTGSGYYTTDRGKTWTVLKGCKTGGKLAITELAKGKYRIINADAGGSMSYTDDFGATWSKCDGIAANKGAYPLVDPNDPKIVYASGATYNDYWSSDMTKKEPTLEESHYSLYVSTDSGATFKEIVACPYGWRSTGMYTNTGDLAYVSKGVVAMAADTSGILVFSENGAKKEEIPFAFAKCIGYGKPEKDGGPNTLFVFGKPTDKDPEGIYRSTDAGKTWVCINTEHLYGGTGNGNYLVGDMDEFGKVYMSTVGCGIVYGQLAGSTPKPTNPKPTDPKPTETTQPTDPKPTETTKPSVPGDKPVVQYCDTNCDGEISIMDVIALNKHLLGVEKLSEPGARNADVDASGKVDSDDALNILKRVIELLTDADFPIKK